MGQLVLDHLSTRIRSHRSIPGHRCSERQGFEGTDMAKYRVAVARCTRCAAVRPAGSCGTDRYPGGAIAARLDDRRGRSGFRIPNRATAPCPRGRDRCAPRPAAISVRLVRLSREPQFPEFDRTVRNLASLDFAMARLSGQPWPEASFFPLSFHRGTGSQRPGAVKGAPPFGAAKPYPGRRGPMRNHHRR
jgi:hypothetical protein